MTEAMSAAPASPSPFAGSAWFDPLEEAVRLQVRGFIEALPREELEAALGRGRYGRGEAAKGHRHGRRPRQLVTTFGPLELSVPRARRHDGTDERAWKSARLPADKRLSHEPVAGRLIRLRSRRGQETAQGGRGSDRASLSRREEHPSGAPCVGQPVRGQGWQGSTAPRSRVSRAWQRTRSAWEAWQKRDLAGEGIVRLILDGTVVKVRLDKRATAISLLIALGIRRDGRKVVLAIKNLGGESEAAWRAILDDLAARGMEKPELVIVDGGPVSCADIPPGDRAEPEGLEAALASLWDDVPVQRCTVHKERNLLAHAPKHLHEEIKAALDDMVHAKTAADVQAKRNAFLATWKLRCRPVADSLEEAGARLFTFRRYPPEQWRSLRTTNAIERRHEEFKRRIKTQCLPPCAETAAMLFWALRASGQITLRKVDGWQGLAQPPAVLDLAA